MPDKEAKRTCDHTGDVQSDSGRPLRVVVDEGLRHVLAKDAPYRVRDLSVGDPNRPDPSNRTRGPTCAK